MPRGPRTRTAEHMYHVTARGVARRPVFETDRDRSRFLEMAAQVIGDRQWTCHSYCLMTTHYHLLIETPALDLPEGMRDLNSGYATWLNAAHEIHGHVFQGRYGARLVRSHEHALEVVRYIPMNPVRARLCADPATWRWSSYRALAGLGRPPSFLKTDAVLAWFDGDPYRYREFVSAGREVSDPEDAALAAIVASGRIDDVAFAHDVCGYPVRAIAAHMGVHHATIARRLRARHATKGV